MCVCVCVCERERERERQTDRTGNKTEIQENRRKRVEESGSEK